MNGAQAEPDRDLKRRTNRHHQRRQAEHCYRQACNRLHRADRA